MLKTEFCKIIAEMYKQERNRNPFNSDNKDIYEFKVKDEIGINVKGLKLEDFIPIIIDGKEANIFVVNKTKTSIAATLMFDNPEELRIRRKKNGENFSDATNNSRYYHYSEEENNKHYGKTRMIKQYRLTR